MKRNKLVSVKRTSPGTTPELLSLEQLPAATPEHSEGHSETPISNTTTTRGGLRPAIDSAVRSVIVEALQTQPGTSHREIARQLDVSHDVVSRIAQKLDSGDTRGQDTQRSLQRQLRKVLPIRERAMQIAAVAMGTAAPKLAFAQISAIKLANELDNVVTAKEQREVADNSVPNLPAMFVMPANTDVDIGVAIKVRTRKNSG